LKGNGNLNGGLITSVGSIVSPGASIGILTVSNNITLSGTTFMEVSKTANTNDQLRATGSITYGGTLTITNLAGTFVGGESYKLFNAASYSGTFATNFPALPAGLAWNTNNLTVNGTISISITVLPPPKITGISQSGSIVTVSGTNNFGGNGQYYVLANTNVATTNWVRFATNNFSAGTFSFTDSISPGVPQRYYRLQLP
jgi:hypothetical protein